MLSEKFNRCILYAGGVCGILWPITSELLFYLLYPILAGDSRIVPGSGYETAVRGMGLLAINQAIIALEWGKVATGQLVLPFLLCLYHLLSHDEPSSLVMVGVGIGLLSMTFSMLTNTIHPTLSHSLGKSYLAVATDTERKVLLAAINGWFNWVRGINQTASLL